MKPETRAVILTILAVVVFYSAAFWYARRTLDAPERPISPRRN